MSQSAIAIKLKLFAAYQEACGASELTLSLPTPTSVKTVLDSLIQNHPELEQWREVTRFGVNYQFVDPDKLLVDGDEVVFIPPVSGG